MDIVTKVYDGDFYHDEHTITLEAVGPVRVSTSRLMLPNGGAYHAWSDHIETCLFWGDGESLPVAYYTSGADAIGGHRDWCDPVAAAKAIHRRRPAVDRPTGAATGWSHFLT